jgi:type IV secretory pathway VirB2 component (pilin)
MKERLKRTGRSLMAYGAAAVFVLRPVSCWATTMTGTGTLPWDQTLTSLQTDLSGPVAHALVVMSFVGSGVLYATSGGHSAGVSRLAAAGLGGSAALGAIQLMSYLFPYSPALF